MMPLCVPGLRPGRDFWLRGAAGALLTLIVLGGLTWAGLAARSMMDAPDPGSDACIRVVIEEGSGTADIARLLERRGLVKSALFFRLLARLRGLDGRLRAGEYDLSPDWDAASIMDKLARGLVVTHPFTVPEGLTVREIAERWAAAGWGTSEEFLAAARDPSVVPDYVPEDPEIVEPVEGYLFPDTYFLRRDASAEEVVRVMRARFEEAAGALLRQRASEIDMTVHEVVTLASIVEEEACVSDERPIISSVFHNRLEKGMRLDADPTVKYVMEAPPERLTYADLEVDSPYNTYRYKGLPPGPIASPGLASIHAALYPADTDYLYFCARNDGTHEFSRTYSEHIKAKRKYGGR